MNTGIQDVHNLAWKLARSCSTAGGRDALLDTYETRAPAGRAARTPTRACRTPCGMLEVFEALGVPIDLGADRAARDARMHGDARRSRRPRARPRGDREPARPLRHARAPARLRLRGRRASSPTARRAPAAANPVRDYRADAPARARACRTPGSTRDGARVSTLDLVADDRFTLLAGRRRGMGRRRAAIAAVRTCSSPAATSPIPTDAGPRCCGIERRRRAARPARSARRVAGRTQAATRTARLGRAGEDSAAVVALASCAVGAHFCAQIHHALNQEEQMKLGRRGRSDHDRLFSVRTARDRPGPLPQMQRSAVLLRLSRPGPRGVCDRGRLPSLQQAHRPLSSRASSPTSGRRR